MSDVTNETQEQPVTGGQQTQAPSKTKPVDAEQPVPVAPSAAQIEVAPQLTEQVTPQYLTQEQLNTALEQQQRQFQSMVDKSEYRARKEMQERLKFADELLKKERVSAYFGDDAEQVRKDAAGDLMLDYYRREVSEPQEPTAPGPTPEQAQAIIETTVELTGIKLGDPDYVDPNTTQSAAQWRTLMQQAYQRRTNLPRPTPQQPTITPQAAPVPPVQAAAVPEAPGATLKPAPVTMGSGEAPRSLTPEELNASYRKAVSDGDRAAMQKWSQAIDNLTRRR